MILAEPEPRALTPLEVERAGERDGKLYELVDGELKEKRVGMLALWIAGKICEAFNQRYAPDRGVAVIEQTIYCFGSPRQGRKPDVLFIWRDRLPGRRPPRGDLFVVPDLVVEVLSDSNSGAEIDRKIEEYEAAGVPLIWIVDPDRRTIRAYRTADGTQRLWRADETLADPLLPDFALRVGDVFFPSAVPQP